MNRNHRKIAIIILTVAGAFIIATGVMGDISSTTTISKSTFLIISVAGGAIFGSSLTMLVEQFMGSEILDIRNYLFNKEKLESAPDYIPSVVDLWHVYYLSKSGGKIRWKYAEYNIKKGHNDNTIIGDFVVSNMSNSPRKYSIEAGLRGDAMMLIAKPIEGQERESLEIIPRITSTHLREHVGIIFLETFDGDFAFSHCIYSRKPLFDRKTLTNEDQVKLDEFLEKTLKRQSISMLSSSDLSKSEVHESEVVE